MVKEEGGGLAGASAVVADDEERLRVIAEFFRGDGGPLGEREKLGSGDAGEGKFIGLAHVDEARRGRAGEPPVRFGDGDFRQGHADQFVIVTGVPTETWLKKISAIRPGMRMQPCEAG